LDKRCGLVPNDGFINRKAQAEPHATDFELKVLRPQAIAAA
jgi:hypothetical protein